MKGSADTTKENQNEGPLQGEEVFVRTYHILLTLLFALGSFKSVFAQGNGRSGDILQMSIDYQTVWLSGADAPPLLTASSPGTARADAGVLGLPTTSLLFGGSEIGNEARQGVRADGWLEVGDLWSIYGGVFFAGNDPDARLTVSSDGTQILGRPFVNAQSGMQDAELVSFPNVLAGAATARQSSDLFFADLGVLQRVLVGTKGFLYVTSGFRFLDFDDKLSVREDLTSIDAGGLVPLGTEFIVNDRFKVGNQFNGVRIGTGISSRSNDWSVDLMANCAIGGLRRQLSISGDTVVTIPGLAPTTTAGGLLAQTTNIGTYRDTTFALVPEFTLRIQRYISSNTSVGLGYTLIFVPDVWFAAEQVDSTVNPSLIGGGALAGPASPLPLLRESNLTIQSLTYGMTLTY